MAPSRSSLPKRDGVQAGNNPLSLDSFQLGELSDTPLTWSNVSAPPTAHPSTHARLIYDRLMGHTQEPAQEQGTEETMLERLIRMYTAAMKTGNTAVIPHLVGPPGVGKSSVIAQLAKLNGVTMHKINVSRLSPLELEGLQMPHGKDEELRLKLLTNPMWTQMKDGDVVNFEEFLRAFPEIYNALLDVLTDRSIGGIQLPKVFFVASSNSVTTYDEALEDRLLHMPVDDIRNSKPAMQAAKIRFLEETGMHPSLIDHPHLHDLMDNIVAPTYQLLDRFRGGGTNVRQPQQTSGKEDVQPRSARNLAGQVALREIRTSALALLIKANNATVMSRRHYRHFIYAPSVDASVIPRVLLGSEKALAGGKLSPTLRASVELNIELMRATMAADEERARLRAENAKKKGMGDEPGDSVFLEDF